MATSDVDPDAIAGGTAGLAGGAALAFSWVNDPSSDIQVVPDSYARVGDTIVYSGNQAVNLTDQALPDLGLVVPFAWPVVENPDGPLSYPTALAWSNALDGWYTPDFGGTGTSLLVTVRIATREGTPNGRVAAGSVAADET